MIQQGERARLAFETGEALRVGGQVRWQYLDRDIATKRRVPRAIDLAHAADTQLGSDFVDAESASGTPDPAGASDIVCRRD